MSEVNRLDPLGYTDEEFHRARCADLEAENAVLQQRIEELETLLSDLWDFIGGDQRYAGSLRVRIAAALNQTEEGTDE